MSTLQSQINIVHLEAGIASPAVAQRTSQSSAFSVNAIEVTTSDETIPLGDITIPQQVMVKLISGDPLRVGLDGSTYPFRLSATDEAMLLRLDVEGLLETSAITCGADTAMSLSGDYFDLTDRAGTVRVWMNILAVAATGSITYNTPIIADTVTVAGTTFTMAAAPSPTEFTNITELTALIDGLASVSATDDGSVISFVATTTGTAGNSLGLAESGTGTLTVSGATLTGGSNASTPPATPGGGRLLPVVIVEDDASTVVAAAVQAALDADAEFNATVLGSAVTAVDQHTGNRTNVVAGTTGWTVGTPQHGGNSPIVHLKSLGVSQVVVTVAPY